MITNDIRLICCNHSARLAPVGFLFERKGSVRVSLDREEKLEDKLEHLVEAAFDANAEDFERDDSSGDTVEVEVRLDLMYHIML